MASFFSRREGTQGTRKVAAAARLAHFYLDLGRRQLHCLNETARELTREGVPLTAADLERQPLQTTEGGPVAPSDLPLVRAWREQAPQEAQFLLTRPGSSPQHLTWSASPLFSDDREVIGVLATLSVAPPEPDWEVLAGLAHDLRTPLQSLRFLVPLLEHMIPPTTESHDLLARLSSSADRAMSIGMDLLEWCRGPTVYGRRVHATWFALAPFLHSLAAEHMLAAQRKSITLTTDLSAAENQEMNSDPVRLGRLLSNLLTNAIRYTSAGRVRFSASWRPGPDGQGQALALSVVDTGTGISAEDLESIFMPFERGKAAKEGDSADSVGSGVGLAVVDRLKQDLGLSLEVYSEFRNGSNFELIIPPQMVRPMGGVGG
jgi:signal transduction histidine kinase